MTVVVPEPEILVPSDNAPTPSLYQRYEMVPSLLAAFGNSAVAIPVRVTEPPSVVPTPTGLLRIPRLDH